MRPFYSDYAGHMLRIFTRHNRWELKDEASRAAYDACVKVMRDLPKDQFDLIVNLYSVGSFEENMEQYRKNRRVWAVLYKVQKKIAKERGLI